ncbi:hypothetical protein [Flagellimonas lutaonensis]|uniref:Uncharacterized protein n=1 Tax=Flagellimonas lutaonensis TaxID=516051 RepID=A0A0D5YPH6_9FLAO|nr:hypothetical protein [Allomuricauda lutaonensis]AKA33844.1 hypothetical protein VC82_152 [Allomuricauda lutaonensis]
MDTKEFDRLQYDSFIERAIKKSVLDIISNRYGFVRNIPKELADDLYAIKSGNLPKKPTKETVNRIKYICELSLSKMSDRRKNMESDPNTFKMDEFSWYQDALKWTESHQKGS